VVPRHGEEGHAEAAQLRCRMLELLAPPAMRQVPRGQQELRRDPGRELAQSGELRTETIGLHQGADSWSVGPAGKHAIAWTDSRKVTSPDPTDGFQDITVIDIETIHRFV
jgi:hypothetical protein